MEQGEKEMRQIFEETTTRNVKAMLQHGNDTRSLVKELEAKVKKLEENIRVFQGIIDEMRQQLSFVQAKLYSGGTE